MASEKSIQETSEAHRLQDLQLLKEEVAEATSKWLVSISLAEETAKRFRLREEEQDLHDACQSGREAAEDLKQKVEDYRVVLAKLERLREAVEGEGGELERLKAEHLRLQALYDAENKGLTDLRQETANVKKRLEALNTNLALLDEQKVEATQALQSTLSEKATAVESLQQRRREQEADIAKEKDRLSIEYDRQKKLQEDLEKERLDHNKRVNEVLGREDAAKLELAVSTRKQAELDAATTTLRSITRHIGPFGKDYSILTDVELVAKAIVAKLSALEENVKTHLRTIQLKDQNIKQNESSIQALQTTNSQLQASKEDLESEYSTLSAKSTSQQETIKEHLQTIMSLEDSVQTTKLDARNFQEEAKQLRTSNNDLRNEKSTLSAENDRTRETVQTQLQTIKSKDVIIDQNESNIRTLQEETERLHGSNNHLKDSSSIHAAEVEKLKREIGELKQSAESSSKEFSDLESLKNTLQSQNHRQSLEIDGLHATHLEQDAKILSIRQQRNKAEISNARLSNQLASCKDELRGLRDDLCSLGEEKSTLESEVQGLREEKDIADTYNKELEVQLQSLEGLQATNETLRITIDPIKAALVDAEKKLASEKATVAEVNHRLDELTTANDGNKEEVKRLRKIETTLQLQSDQKSAQLKEEFEKSHQQSVELRDLQIQISELQDQQRKDETSFATASEEITVLKARNTELETEVEKVKTLENERKTLEAELNTMKVEANKVPDLEQQMEVIRIHNQQLLSDAKETIAIEQQLAAAQQDKKQVESKVFDLEQQLKALQERKKQLESEADAVTGIAQQLESMQKHKGQLESRVPQLEAQLTDLQNRNRYLEGETGKVTDLQKELVFSQAQYQQLRGESDRASSLQQELAAAQTRIQYLESEANQVASLQGELQTHRESSQHLRGEAKKVSGLQQQLASAQTKVQSLQIEADKVPGLQKQLLDMSLQQDQTNEASDTANLKAKVSNLEQRLSTSSNQLKPLLKEREQLMKERDRLSKTLADERSQREASAESTENGGHDDLGLNMPPQKRQRTSNTANTSPHGASRQSSSGGTSQLKTYGSTRPDKTISSSRAGRSNPDSLNQHTIQDGEPWNDVEDIRDPDFSYGELPQRVFDLLRQQISGEKGWDILRPEWMDGTKSGEPKCAHQFAHHHGSDVRNGVACDACMNRSSVCAAVSKGKIQIRPLPPNERGQATKAEMGYWVLGIGRSDSLEI
ncbi:MAG: hypothetical protein L6R41_003879 [Letrouitia leprolyta]|nr:MAG: hypothetical protein L6R41_003879 [Letrouitia leprolyta]